MFLKWFKEGRVLAKISSPKKNVRSGWRTFNEGGSPERPLLSPMGVRCLICCEGPKRPVTGGTIGVRATNKLQSTPETPAFLRGFFFILSTIIQEARPP